MRDLKLAIAALVLVAVLSTIVASSGKIAVGQGSCPAGQLREPCSGVPEYADGQCTCYVAKRALESGSWGGGFPSRLGNAYEWDNKASADYGLSVGTIPYPNSIVVWEANVPGVSYGYGHVSYVESVAGTAEHSFTVAHMNFCGGDSSSNATNCINCVARSNFNAADFGEGSIHFIYPPSDTPVQLWPYESKRIEFREQIRLQWYGDFDEYVIWYSLVYPDGTGGGGLLGPVRTEHAVLSLDRPAYVGWLVLGYDDDGGRSGVESNDGIMQWFYSGPCPACGSQTDTTLLQQCGAGTIGDPCSAESNPVPPSTSTPFTTPTNVPPATVRPTSTTAPPPVPTPTSSWFTPTVWHTPAPTNTPGGGLATPTIAGPTATHTPPPIPTPTSSWFTPTVVYTPLPTSTPGGGLATPTLVGVTATPCTPLLAVGDFDCDCRITIEDIQTVANRWRCGLGDTCFREMYDLNDDGIINSVDIMMVNTHLGESCGG
jgi:surface antigen